MSDISLTYFLGGGAILLAVFLIVLISTIVGIIRMNITTYKKCPSCSEKMANGVIICKSCGVNMNSLQDYTYLTNASFARRVKNYVDNLHPNRPAALAILQC
ncbi:hypothetical protein RCG23_13195 [Neobacillus sp. PS3-34]|uniref:hypothetical protein n=1 Tax=Neobacillus sp. PS3-34 TaxID=3070678 RepID=UPI0027DEEED3|nr:hypothetical protein [Neobacillus sp. PS3-34]WML46611.1 hypothetical protein RCG23_13195 [Neobacillus sp. PS3-34]